MPLPLRPWRWFCFGFLLLPAAASAQAAAPAEPTLLTSRLLIAPTAEQLAAWPRFAPRWIVPAGLRTEFDHAARAAGLPPDLVLELAAAIQPLAPDAPTGRPRHAIVPDANLLARFTPVTLAAWHHLLAADPANLTSRWPLVQTTADLAALTALPGGAPVAEAFRRGAVRSPDPDCFILHDLWLLHDPLATAPDPTRLLTRLLAARPLLAKVRIADDDPATARATAAYWQVNGRFRAIEPILQAVGAVTDRDRIDLLHLLPQTARGVLNTFPPALAQLLDPRTDNATAAVTLLGLAEDDALPADLRTWLESAARPLDRPSRFGDVVVFADPVDGRWPLAYVYLADGVAFGRAPTLGGPWGLWPLAELAALNPRLAYLPVQAYRARRIDADAVPADFVAPALPPAWLQPSKLEPLPPGPWGRLWTFEISLAPSASFFAALPPPSPQPRWTFPAAARAEVETWITAPDLSVAQRNALQIALQQATVAADGTWSVTPPLELVRHLPADWRAQVYARLLPARRVTDYAQELRVTRPPGPTEVPPAIHAALAPLLYPRNQRFAFADYGLIYHLSDDPLTRIALLQTLCRTPARIVLLERPTPAEAPAVAAYWSAGGRKNLSLLLEAFAAQDDTRFLDLAHLLPALPREYLNLFTVPVPGEPTPSCYWSALNFGRAEPDDSFMVSAARAGGEHRHAERELQTRYRPIDRPERPGDIIAYYHRDLPGGPYHLCNSLAAGLVFSRNGLGFQAPWCILPAAEVDALYLDGDRVTVRYYRPADAAAWAR